MTKGRHLVMDLASKILLIGWTTDALLYHNRWKVIGTCPKLRAIPFPNYKVKIESEIFRNRFRWKGHPKGDTR